MCSIFGAYGPPGSVSVSIIQKLAVAGRDRGRDGTRFTSHQLQGGEAFVGCARAAPTTEVETPELQPYEGIVHNGTIANDKELGNPVGQVDSMVLRDVLQRDNLNSMVASVARLAGSFAIAATGADTLFLARNYKPIHLWADGPVTYFSSMARHFEGIVPWGQAPVEMEPYSVLDVARRKRASLRPHHFKSAVVVASSGLDSTTAAWMLKAQGYDVCLLHFRYGCRAEAREVDAIKLIADRLGGRLEFVDLPEWRSSLLDPSAPIAGSIKGAEFAHEWVPARNLFFLSAAIAWAEGQGYHYVALGNNLEEAGAYPDNEEQMTTLMDRVADYAVADGYGMRVLAPVGRLMKHEIVAEGLRLRVPYELTWSCYKSARQPCHDCGPCFMREEAFRRNGAVDPLREAS